MKSKQIPQVRELIDTEAFRKWYARYTECRERREHLRVQGEDPLVNRLFLAGDYETLAARAQASFNEIDADFEALSAFEIQRQLATAVFEELQNAENGMETLRQAASDVRARLEAQRKQGSGGATDAQHLQAELDSLEGRMVAVNLSVESLTLRLKSESGKKDEIWATVQDAWIAAFRANMARAEHGYQARRLRHGSAMQAAAAGKGAASAASPPAGAGDDSGRDRGNGMEAKLEEVQNEFEGLLDEAQGSFHCCLVEEFLYWPLTGSKDMVICVPLVSENTHLNVQVSALAIYQMNRDKGLDFIEPVPQEREEDEDARLAAFFR